MVKIVDGHARHDVKDEAIVSGLVKKVFDGRPIKMWWPDVAVHYRQEFEILHAVDVRVDLHNIDVHCSGDYEKSVELAKLLEEHFKTEFKVTTYYENSKAYLPEKK